MAAFSIKSLDKPLDSLEKYAGLVAVGSLWLAIPASAYIAKLNIFGSMPISSLGVDPSTKWLFSTALVVASAAFSLFALRAHKRLDSSALAPAVLIAGQLAQIIVAFAPYNAHNFWKPAHVTAAYILGFSMPIAMALFTLTAKNKQFHSLNLRLLQIEVVLFSLGIGWFIFGSKAGAFSEIVTALAFDVWVVMLTIKMLAPQADRQPI